MLVGGDLDLDVAGGGDEPFEIHPLVAERRARLAAREAEEVVELVAVAGELDSSTAAAARRLDQQRIPNLVGRCACIVARFDLLPGRTGTPARAASSRARSLSPLSSITSAGGPMKMSPFSCARAASFGLSDRNP